MNTFIKKKHLQNENSIILVMNASGSMLVVCEKRLDGDVNHKTLGM